MLKETEPLYFLLQVVNASLHKTSNVVRLHPHRFQVRAACMQDAAVFQERTVQFLLHVDCAVLHHVDRVASLSLDYTPQLLSNYMQLFCNAVRLQLLARGMPRRLIIQLHTLLLNLSQVRRRLATLSGSQRRQLGRQCCLSDDIKN